MPMLFWLPMIVSYGMCQVIEEEVRLYAAAVHAQCISVDLTEAPVADVGFLPSP